MNAKLSQDYIIKHGWWVDLLEEGSFNLDREFEIQSDTTASFSGTWVVTEDFFDETGLDLPKEFVLEDEEYKFDANLDVRIDRPYLNPDSFLLLKWIDFTISIKD